MKTKLESKLSKGGKGTVDTTKSAIAKADELDTHKPKSGGGAVKGSGGIRPGSEKKGF